MCQVKGRTISLILFGSGRDIRVLIWLFKRAIKAKKLVIRIVPKVESVCPSRNSYRRCKHQHATTAHLFGGSTVRFRNSLSWLVTKTSLERMFFYNYEFLLVANIYPIFNYIYNIFERKIFCIFDLFAKGDPSFIDMFIIHY